MPLSRSTFGNCRGAAMSCDWEGNRRSGVALVMCHRLKWFIHLWPQGLSKEDEHPTNTPYSMVIFTIPHCNPVATLPSGNIFCSQWPVAFWHHLVPVLLVFVLLALFSRVTLDRVGCLKQNSWAYVEHIFLWIRWPFCHPADSVKALQTCLD